MKNKISTSEVLQEVLMVFHAKDKLKEIEVLLEDENVSIEDVKKGVGKCRREVKHLH